jgi:hypothetical protein
MLVRRCIARDLRSYIWRKITGGVTVEFLEAAVERMFNADEVSSVVDLAKLKELKHRIVQLFVEMAVDEITGDEIPAGQFSLRTALDGRILFSEEIADPFAVSWVRPRSGGFVHRSP